MISTRMQPCQPPGYMILQNNDLCVFYRSLVVIAVSSHILLHHQNCVILILKFSIILDPIAM